ncbi:STAS domain-containing protein [Actinoplanes sp. NPDC051851]|uniref:STAS domain-containing protein n=1 Tax=Actinoplanes sp. NPDC051851 TaxID=3154753 RepID=UPI00342ACCED
MAEFEASTFATAGRVTVTVSGECDLSVRERLTAVLLDAVNRGPRVFVDVAAVSFLDSSGVHALVTAHHAAQGRGGRLFVTNAAGAVATVLELTGLDALFQAPAEAALPGPEERRHA